MKLAAAAIGISVLTVFVATIGYFAGPEDEAGLRAFGLGVITLVLSSIAAFMLGFVLTRKNPLLAGLGLAGVLLVTAAAAVIAFFAGSEKEAVPRAFAIGFLTLVVVGGMTYLIYYAVAMKRLDLPKEELDHEEVVWAKTAKSMVHYKSGNPLKFWEAVGGRLFLTNQALEFRTFPAELYTYQIVVPLREIRRASPCNVLGIIRGALRIERRDGTFELFNFGAAFDMSREWAEAIMDFRDDLQEMEASQADGSREPDAQSEGERQRFQRREASGPTQASDRIQSERRDSSRRRPFRG